MTLTEICVDREQAERLKKAGYPQDKTAFIHMIGRGYEIPYGRATLNFNHGNWLAAPTLEELWIECGRPDILNHNPEGWTFYTLMSNPARYESINCYEKDLKSALVELYERRGPHGN